MASKRKQQIEIMLSLCVSIVEGAEYLLTHPFSRRLRQDTDTGLGTLCENMLDLAVDPWLVYATRWLKESVAKGLFVHELEFRKMLYHWYCLSLKELKCLLEEENAKCPVCGQIGSPAYFALLFEEQGGNGKEKALPQPARLWLRCSCCGSSYLAEDRLSSAKKEKAVNARSFQTRCKRVSEALSQQTILGEKSSLLFVGAEDSPLLQFLTREGNKVRIISLKDFAGGILPPARQTQEAEEIQKKTFSTILIDHMADTADVKTVLKMAGERLTAGGLLWFDMPDFENSLKCMEEKGKTLWNQHLPEISIKPERMKIMAGECGFKIKTYKRLKSLNACAEYTAVKIRTADQPLYL